LSNSKADLSRSGRLTYNCIPIFLCKDTNNFLVFVAYLYSIRIDYSAACLLVSKRRFLLPTHRHETFHIDPFGVPEYVRRRFPVKFDLYKEIGSIIQESHKITIVIRADGTSAFQNLENNAIITRLNTKLSDSIRIQDPEGGSFRPMYLLQSFYILALVYAALVLGYEGLAADLFVYRFEKALVDGGTDFGIAIGNLFRLLLACEDLTSDTFGVCMSELVDVAMTMDWSSWRDVKNMLLDFLVHDPACHGQLQDLWKERMASLLRAASPLEEHIAPNVSANERE
jgi:hypothetical protein